MRLRCFTRRCVLLEVCHDGLPFGAGICHLCVILRDSGVPLYLVERCICHVSVDRFGWCSPARRSAERAPLRDDGGLPSAWRFAALRALRVGAGGGLRAACAFCAVRYTSGPCVRFARSSVVLSLIQHQPCAKMTTYTKHRKKFDHESIACARGDRGASAVDDPGSGL